MFFNLIKEINMLLSDVLDSVKEINRLTKEINRLLSKGLSNIFLKVTIETFSNLRFSGFKNICHVVSFDGLELTQMSLNL